LIPGNPKGIPPLIIRENKNDIGLLVFLSMKKGTQKDKH
jgi:hypothetical protein